MPSLRVVASRRGSIRVTHNIHNQHKPNPTIINYGLPTGLVVSWPGSKAEASPNRTSAAGPGMGPSLWPSRAIGPGINFGIRLPQSHVPGSDFWGRAARAGVLGGSQLDSQASLQDSPTLREPNTKGTAHSSSLDTHSSSLNMPFGVHCCDLHCLYLQIKSELFFPLSNHSVQRLNVYSTSAKNRPHR
jgi:hypothetical protein